MTEKDITPEPVKAWTSRTPGDMAEYWGGVPFASTGFISDNYAGNYNDAPNPSVHPSLRTDNYPQMAKNATALAFYERCKTVPVGPESTYVVWFVKTLKDWCAMTSTTVEDGLYYKVAFNSSTGFIVVETFKKIHQQILDGYAYTENGPTSWEHFAAGRASSVYNFLNHPSELPMQADDWKMVFDARTFHNRKIVLQSIFTAMDMFEITYDHGANNIYVDAYKLISTDAYTLKQVNG